MRTEEQLGRLAGHGASFTEYLGGSSHHARLGALSLQTMQVNVGRVCNQACHHCHVAAGPQRTEQMDLETVEACVALLEGLPEVHTVDITGGAPEINPHFRHLVRESRRLGKRVIDRCNLTVLEEPGFEYLYEFLTAQGVAIVASLPHFSASRTDAQRGRGVFDRSILALQKLNRLGYGRDAALRLDLVYNPTGVFLSAPQAELERDFKSRLFDQHGVEFNSLFCINNMPISRFLEALIRSEKFDVYMETLVNAFNPQTVEGLMCRHQMSIGYDGQLYDCDFNQMLDLNASVGHISEFSRDAFVTRDIVTANHCFGCTAGAGSSCGGELAQKTVGSLSFSQSAGATES